MLLPSRLPLLQRQACRLVHAASGVANSDGAHRRLAADRHGHDHELVAAGLLRLLWRLLGRRRHGAKYALVHAALLRHAWA